MLLLLQYKALIWWASIALLKLLHYTVAIIQHFLCLFQTTALKLFKGQKPLITAPPAHKLSQKQWIPTMIPHKLWLSFLRKKEINHPWQNGRKTTVKSELKLDKWCTLSMYHLNFIHLWDHYNTNKTLLITMIYCRLLDPTNRLIAGNHSNNANC